MTKSLFSARPFLAGVARGYVYACRVAYPNVALMGGLMEGSHSVLGPVVAVIGIVGAGFAWGVRIERIG